MMDKSKILVLASIISILILTFIAIETRQPITGKITTIKYSNAKIEITLEQLNETLVLFTTQILELQKGDKIIVSGKKTVYQGKKQIIVDKIIKSN